MGNGSVLRVFRIAEFRVVWAAELLSLVGDQLARVAVAVLVVTRTGSATLAALAYALTLVPALVGGVTLSWVADRFRRRTVMIVADLTRAALVATMALPALPLPVLCVLLVAVVLLTSPHTAAQGALLPAILGESYERGLAVRQITAQAALLVGFAAGGLVVAAAAPSGALLLDAATFAVSAVTVRLGIMDRPAAAGPGERVAPGSGRTTLALRTILGDPSRRALVLLALVVACFVAPEALAAPYVAEIGAGPITVGLLMAAPPLGGVVGAWAFVRFVPLPLRERLVGPVAMLAAVPLLAMVAAPPVPVVLVLWGLSGACATAYLLQTQASFVRRTPDRMRGQAIGVASSAIIAAQGLAVLLAGVAADAWRPSTAVAVSGLVGVVGAAAAGYAWSRVRRPPAPDDRTPVVRQ